jgi:type II secretion system protein N
VSPAKKASGRPGSLQMAALIVAAVLLTATFAYLRFPYDRLAASLAARFDEAGVRVQIGGLHANPTLAGPGLAAEDLRVTRPDGTVVRVDSLRVRPAWSLSWLAARPAFHLDLESPQGAIDGVAVLWGPRRFSGSLRDVDLNGLLGTEGLAGARVEGRASFDVDVALEASGPTGPVHVVAKDGVLTHPQIPMAIPYEELHGDLALGGDSLLKISDLQVSSPLGTGTLHGSVGRAPDPRQAPLDLELAVQVAQSIRSSLTSQGVRVGRDGELHYKISGTAAAPIVR